MASKTEKRWKAYWHSTQDFLDEHLEEIDVIAERKRIRVFAKQWMEMAYRDGREKAVEETLDWLHDAIENMRSRVVD